MAAEVWAWMATSQATASGAWLVGLGLFANLLYVAARDFARAVRVWHAQFRRAPKVIR